MMKANLGASVVVIGKHVPTNTMINVGRGRIFFRQHFSSALKSIRVDIVWFVDPPSNEIESLGRELVRTSLSPQILEGHI
jgi:hypothetical protein